MKMCVEFHAECLIQYNSMRYVLLGFYLGLAGIAFAQTNLAGLGVQAVDFALVRNFTLTERARFQFRAEFLNALSPTNLATPNRFVNTPQFGSISEAATPGRQVQLSARISL